MYRILLLDTYKYNKIKHNQMFFSKYDMSMKICEYDERV